MPTRTWATAPAGVAAAIESATYVVAASDSQDPTRADYQCDGVADEVEINAAITALPAGIGGCVTLLEGTYNISASITIARDNMTLMGAGHGTELSGAIGIAIILVSAGYSHITIKDLQIDGNDISRYGISFFGTSPSRITWCRIEGCWIHNVDGEGIYLDYTDNSEILNNQLIANDANQILLLHSPDNLVFGNQAEAGTTAASGIAVTTSSHRNRIIGNRCNNNAGIGIIVGTSTECLVCDNITYLNTSDGIEFSGVDYGVVDGNISYSNGQHGISLISSDQNTVTCNNCYNNTEDGISLSTDGDENEVCGNRCYANTGFGIDIAVAACADNRVVDNQLMGNTAGCINDLGTRTMLPEVQVPILDDTDAQVDKSTQANAVGEHMSLIMATNQDVHVRFDFRVPSNFQELVRARIVVVPTALNPTLRWAVATSWGLCNEAYDAGTDTIALDNIELDQNQLECLDINAALDGITAGDHVGVDFERNGASVDDDAGDTHIIIFWMQYV